MENSGKSELEETRDRFYEWSKTFRIAGNLTADLPETFLSKREVARLHGISCGLYIAAEKLGPLIDDEKFRVQQSLKTVERD